MTDTAVPTIDWTAPPTWHLNLSPEDVDLFVSHITNPADMLTRMLAADVPASPEASTAIRALENRLRKDYPADGEKMIERINVEADQVREIDRHRANLRLALAGIADHVNTARGSLNALMSSTVYDVEVAESRAGITMTVALDQIDIAVAALRSLAPEPGR